MKVREIFQPSYPVMKATKFSPQHEIPNNGKKKTKKLVIQAI
jgi:hypothetical protein